MNAKLIGLLLVGALTGPAWLETHAVGATSAATNAPAKPFVAPKSLFVAARDPFYPDRKIGPGIPDKGSPLPTPVADPSELIVRQLALKGLTRSPEGRRVATISGTEGKAVDFGQGEVRDVRVAGKAYKIKCVEILDKSVYVTIEGSSEKRELRIRDGL